MDATKSPWNSLEIAKLVSSILLPIAVVAFGFITKEALQVREYETRLSEAVIEKRKEVYEEIRIPINNIYSYIEEVGGYKNFTPQSISEDRRKVHLVMHTQRAYWSPATFAAYLDYMDRVAFKTWQGVNTDALIRDDPGQKRSLPSWKDDWSSHFSGPQDPEHKQAYNKLIDMISLDLRANIGG